MRKCLLILFLALTLGLSGLPAWPARAQAAPRLTSLEIDLWPEYDRPALLVIYRAILAPEVSLPAQLVFRIPAGVTEPTVVAVGATLAEVADAEYTVRASGEWSEVSFLATGPAIQFEYYDPGLKKEGPTRSFAFAWPGGFSVDQASIQVQQPIDTTQMTIEPALDPGTAGQDGLTYYTKEIGALAADEEISLQVNYQKATDTLSVRSQPVEPSSPITSSGDVNNLMRTVMIIVGVVLGLLLIAGGAWWYWQSGQTRDRPQPVRRRRKPVAARETGPAPAEGYVYCHNCGKRAGPGDRFCRTCGTKLRIE